MEAERARALAVRHACRTALVTVDTSRAELGLAASKAPIANGFRAH
jgi:hypothetical protein